MIVAPIATKSTVPSTPAHPASCRQAVDAEGVGIPAEVVSVNMMFSLVVSVSVLLPHCAGSMRRATVVNRVVQRDNPPRVPLPARRFAGGRPTFTGSPGVDGWPQRSAEPPTPLRPPVEVLSGMVEGATRFLRR